MNRIVIFSGTTEGRMLAQTLSENGIHCIVSVATEYGEIVMPEMDGVTVHKGRMDLEEMQKFITQSEVAAVVDATHPFATAVSENIRESLKNTEIPYIRLQRETSDIALNKDTIQENHSDVILCSDATECADFLSFTDGNILLTTGSKDLATYSRKEALKDRLFVRVLPGLESLSLCEKNGICGKQIIAMQGPFSTEMNTLFLRQTKAEWLLTKDSGRAGGFQEKVEAARENGTRVVVIRRPEEDGISLEEAMEVLKKADEGNVGELKTHLILAGIGMGQPSQMTGEVLRSIRESDALIGAGRMLESAERALQNDLLISKEGKAENRQESAAAVEKETKCYKAYLPDDVIQIVSKHPEWKQAVILYSGDTGFFSGASRMAERLREAGYPFTVYPGTSCVSYLAARLGTHWEDAAIYSAHGRELSVDRVMKRLCDPEEPAKRAFILMGGKNGAGQFCERLTQAGYGNVQVTVGENLSYPEEQIRSGTAEEMKKLEFADLSLMLLEVTDEIKNVKQLKRFEQEDKRLLPADSVGVFPRIMLAAPKSGSGKTLLTCGLLEVLRRRGLNPIACKCGPDYIDPMFHRYVLGIPGRNLDSFFLPTEGVRKVLVDAVREEQAGIAVLEGVMGYYDGLGGTETSASSWEIAEITDTPAILVLDCKGASLSAAAMASGFLHFRKKSHIAGVILNRVSSMYYERLAAAVEEASGLPVLGYLPESEEYRMESRHLGLFLPGEIDRLRERIGRLADQMEKSIAVDRVLEVAGMLPLRIENKEKEKAENESMEAESIAKFPACQEQKVTSRVRIGVARDEAFCFYYQENFRLLEQMGAELVYFSPLRDKKIPDRVDGLLFGGGYPENYARELAKNAAMRESIRRSIAAGMPFLAECGGFLYLHRTLEGSDGKHWEMAGVYPFDAYRTNRLRRFGYVRLLTSSGQEIHGHEFHYWESEDPGTDWEAVKPTGNRSWRCIHEKGGQIGGFPHLYYASCPDFLRKWLDVCAKGSQKKYIN